MTTGWHDLGRFRILAMPLPTNEYWTTHRIFLKGKFVAAQLSVPSLEQCEDRLAERNLQPSAPRPEWAGWRGRKPGRPTKAEAERELTAAISGD